MTRFARQGISNTVCTTKLVVSGTLNYEETVKHEIIVRATDKGGKFKTTKFTVQVVDINDKPTVYKDLFFDCCTS